MSNSSSDRSSSGSEAPHPILVVIEEPAPNAQAAEVGVPEGEASEVEASTDHALEEKAPLGGSGEASRERALLILKDEGEKDEAAEKWLVETRGDKVRVTALSGPHEGAVGLAERTEADPREDAS